MTDSLVQLRQLAVLLTLLVGGMGELVFLQRTEEASSRISMAGRGERPGFPGLLPGGVQHCTRYPNGTCHSPSMCAQLGGLAEGSCVTGTCCYFLTSTEEKENEVAEIRTCGETSSGNGTSFVNPSYPNTDTTLSNCELTVHLLSNNICQLRLDFDSFELEQPNVNGECEVDFMKIIGFANDNTVPTLCGTNTGQHMYVDVDPTGGNPKINIDTGTTSSVTRGWKINVQQIACDSPYKAPEGCTQYYRDSSGTVESFNYVRPTEIEIMTSTANLHLNNLRYGVCVASRSGYCSITWSKNDIAGDNPYTFMMTGDGDVISPDLVGTVDVSEQGAANCPTDYVIIPGGVFEDPSVVPPEVQADRFCGLGFPNQVTSSIQPFIMYVTTDDIEGISSDTANVGFSLQYRQNSC